MPVGKNQIVCKYVTFAVLNTFSMNQRYLQYFETADEENTEIILVDGDISVIDLSDILYKLPSPELRFKNRQYLSVFQNIVNVLEKFK